MAAILVSFQMIGFQDLRSHSRSGPFANQPLFDHFKSKQVCISDPHCRRQCLTSLGCWTRAKHSVLTVSKYWFLAETPHGRRCTISVRRLLLPTQLTWKFIKQDGIHCWGVVQLGGLFPAYPMEVPLRLRLVSLFSSLKVPLKLKIKNTIVTIWIPD